MWNTAARAQSPLRSRELLLPHCAGEGPGQALSCRAGGERAQRTGGEGARCKMGTGILLPALLQLNVEDGVKGQDICF